MAEHEKHEEGHGEAHGSSHGGGGGHGAHGGGGHEEHEGAPEWLISFADNVALIMGFFVILLAMNMAKPTAGGIGGEGKMGGSPSPDMVDFVIAMREAFNNPISMTGGDPRESVFRERMRQKTSKGSAESIGPEGRHEETQAIRPSDYYKVNAIVPFDESSADVGRAAEEIVARAARELAGQRWVVEIRGHASPYESFGRHAESMDLSYRRAKAVAALLTAEGMKWEQLRLVASGDHSRVVSRPTDRAMDAPNRRVEIVLTEETLAPDPFSGDSSALGRAQADQKPEDHGEEADHGGDDHGGSPRSHALPASKSAAPAKSGGH